MKEAIRNARSSFDVYQRVTNLFEALNDEGYELAIEAVVDKVGFKPFMDILQQVCYEKSVHLESNWQDKESANIWEEWGNKLGELA